MPRSQKIYKNIGRDYDWWDSLWDTLWAPFDWISGLWNSPYSLLGGLFNWSTIDKLHSFVYSHTRSLKIQVSVTQTLGYNFFYSEQRYHDADLLKVLQLALKEIKEKRIKNLKSIEGALNYSQSYQICLLYYRTLLSSLINVYRRYSGMSVDELNAADKQEKRLLSFKDFFSKTRASILEMNRKAGLPSSAYNQIKRLLPEPEDMTFREEISVSEDLKSRVSKLSNIEFTDGEDFYNGNIEEVRNKNRLLIGCAKFYKILFELENMLHWVAHFIEYGEMTLIAEGMKAHRKYSGMRV